jgi:hypothetical protein
MDVRGTTQSLCGNAGLASRLFRRILPLAAWCIAGSFLPRPLLAQEALHPSVVGLRDSLRVSSLGFDRVLNTFLWNGTMFYDRRFNDVDVAFRQFLRSRLIRTDQRSVQDEYGDSLNLGVPLGERWQARLQQSSAVISDNRAIDLTKLAQHQVLVGVRAHPAPRVTFGLLGGYEIDAQQDERDEGFAYRATIGAEDLRLEEFRGAIRGGWAQSLLTRRRPASGNLDVALVREFGSDAKNTILVSYDMLRREFYTAAGPDVQQAYQTSSNIFRRDASTFEVSEQLDYRSSEKLRLIFRGGLLNRTIDRALSYKVFSATANTLLDTRIQEMQLYAEAGTIYQPAEWLGLDVNLSYREREERHRVTGEAAAPVTLVERQQRSESRLENIAQRTSIASQVRARLSDSDELNFAGSASILRYDTPDTTNVDERDELLVTLGVQERHRFNSELLLIVSADVSLSHLVYLKSVQSANNNWNRVVRLSPTVIYEPSEDFRTVNQAEVLGNYTVYDFEGQGALTRSFSFRQASWLDSTSIRISQLLRLSVVGEIRTYERGILVWEEFKERPQNYFVEQTYWPQVVYEPARHLRLALGYRYFGQNRYKYHGGSRILERQLETAGPTVSVVWEGFSSQQVSVEGWNETQRQDKQVTRTIPNLSLRVTFSI